jgi:hypothetical protein
MNGMFTPIEAFKIAKTLHDQGKFDVNIRLAHPRGSYAARGDSDRNRGKTAEVTIEVEYGSELDQLVGIRNKIREIGYDAQYDSSSFTILGVWHGS